MSQNQAPPPYQPQSDPQYERQSTDHDYEKNSSYADNIGSGMPQYSEDFDNAFKIEKPKYNDWPFAIFFLAVLAGFIALSGYTINAYRKSYLSQGSGIYDSDNSSTLSTNAIIMFLFAIAIAVVLATFVIAIARMTPKKFIAFGLICNVILGIGTAIAYFCMKYWSAAIVFLVFSLLCAWSYWTCRSRIPFSAAVLTIVIDVMKAHPSVLIASLLGVILSGAFGVLLSVTIASTYMKYDTCDSSVSGTSCSHSKLIGLLVFEFFAGYYITEVLRNTIHATISGVYGTWYYLSKSDQGEPKNSCLGSLKRALTYSFGSICLGSLIEAIISLIRQGVNILKQNAVASNEMVQMCIFCVLDIILSVIEWLVKWFNHYAYSYIALYGKSYTNASKDIYELFKFKGMDALINDCLIGTSLNFYNLFVAYVTALFTFLYLRLTKPEYNSDGSFYAPLIAFSFLIAGQITNVTTTVITSGTTTFFIALARDPEVFKICYPERFEEIFRAYPEVLNKINLPHSN